MENIDTQSKQCAMQSLNIFSNKLNMNGEISSNDIINEDELYYDIIKIILRHYWDYNMLNCISVRKQVIYNTFKGDLFTCSQLEKALTVYKIPFREEKDKYYLYLNEIDDNNIFMINLLFNYVTDLIDRILFYYDNECLPIGKNDLYIYDTFLFCKKINQKYYNLKRIIDVMELRLFEYGFTDKFISTEPNKKISFVKYISFDNYNYYIQMDFYFKTYTYNGNIQTCPIYKISLVNNSDNISDNDLSLNIDGSQKDV